MPKLSELKVPPLEAQAKFENIPHTNPTPPLMPVGVNPFLRCSMPTIKPVSPDSLRQFYRDGTAQTRIISS